MNRQLSLGLAGIALLAPVLVQAADPAPVATAPAAAPAAPAAATSFQDALMGGKSLTNFRLRYEHVEQDAQPSLDDADAVTLRSLIGWQTKPFYGLSLGAQMIAVTKLNGDFNDFAYGVNESGKSRIAVVNDPDFLNMNQLYLDFTGLPDTKIRAGRQSLKLDNVRFIGNVEFRQVMQVFDGVTVENRSLPNTEIMGGYYYRLRKINTDLRPDDTGILHIAYKLTPTDTLTAYTYWYDMNDVSIARDGSNVTYGFRADGAHPLAKPWKVLYTAEYARQDDLDQSSRRTVAQGRIDADYYHVGLGAGWGDWFARFDREQLSSNDGLYAFQTPLGTNHLFQGWVDKFLVTPVHGIDDNFLTGGWTGRGFTVLSEYHIMDSNRDFAKLGGGTGDNYGNEWDISLAYAYDKHVTGKVEYGHFWEGDAYISNARRIRDTSKLWLTLLITL